MTPSPAQIRAARALLDWKQDVLAARAGLHSCQVSAAERQHIGVHAERLVRVLAAAGVRFIPGGVVLEQAA